MAGTSGSRPPGGPQSLLPYAGFALAIAGIIYQGGILSSTVQQNSARLTVLEAADKARTLQLEQMNIRGERSAAKLDFLVERAQDEEKRR